jgi:hypothetical protein
MKLSTSQQSRFWREWEVAKRAQQWVPRTAEAAKTSTEIEAERHALLLRAGFTSLKLVDRTNGFDRVLMELGRLRDNVREVKDRLPGPEIALPAGSGAALHTDSPGTRKRFLYLIGKHLSAIGGEAYLKPFRARFGLVQGVRGIEDLGTKDLHELLITLSARNHAKGNRAAEASLSIEESFADDVEFLSEPGEAEWVPAEPVGAVPAGAADCPF